nr:LysR substrate-binding domain-containing protein [uncultured Celeribacter sp.]
MRFSQIRAFHYVAKYEGFSHAAVQLQQSQPTLSDQVKRLEQQHDVLLFHRAGRRVHLTEAGKALFQMTTRLFDLEAEIDEHLRQSRSAIDGTLRIIADSASHIAPQIARFRQKYPKVFLQIRAGNTQQVLQALRRYEAEIGVLGSFDLASDIDAVPLSESPIMAIVAKGAFGGLRVRATLEALQAYPLVMREDGSRTRRRLEDAARHRGIKLAPVIEVEGREAMREIVARGVGVGFISEAEMGLDPRIESIAIEGVALHMPESAICLRTRRDLPMIRAFMRGL